MIHWFRKQFMQFAQTVLAPALVGLFLLTGYDLAQAQSKEPRIEQAWAAATVPAQPVGAVYLQIISPEPVSLVQIDTPVARRVQIHNMTAENGVMKMRRMRALQIPAGQPVELTPGGTHFMLLGLKNQLKTGETVSLTLTFQRADKSQITVPVDVPVKTMSN